MILSFGHFGFSIDHNEIGLQAHVARTLLTNVFFSRYFLLFVRINFLVWGVNSCVDVTRRIVGKFWIKLLMEELLFSQHDTHLLKVLRFRCNVDVPWVVDDSVLDR